MKKNLLAFMLTIVMLLSIIPQSVQAKPSFPASQTIYLTGYDFAETLNVTKVVKGENIPFKNVKVNKKGIIKPISSKKFNKVTSAKNNTYKITFKPQKAGKVTLSFKVANTKKKTAKTYKVNYTVRKYENPLKTVKITGVNGGNNFAHFYNRAAKRFDALLTGKNGAHKLTIEGKTNWKISYITYIKNGKSVTKKYKKSVSKATIDIGTRKMGENIEFSVMMVNTKTKGKILVR